MLSSDVVLELENKFINYIPKSSDFNLSEVYVSHIEPAFWYYDDILRSQNPEIHHFKTFRSFSKALFIQSNNLANLCMDFSSGFIAYKKYRSQVPVCGGILLNEDGDKVLLVRDFNSMSWMFPRGKKIPGESDVNCAIREIMEETSFDITNYVNETDFITMNVNSRVLKFFIVRNVPESYKFRPQTIKEISGLKFYSLNAIPSNSFHITQLLQPLLEWLRLHNNNNNNNNNTSTIPIPAMSTAVSTTAAAPHTTTTTTTITTQMHSDIFDSFQLDVNRILHVIDLAFECST